MQESESHYHQKHRVQFKDQHFLAGNSCIIEINSCEKCHRKKQIPDLITRGWVKSAHTHLHPPSPLTKRKDEYISYFVDHILIVFVLH